MGKGKEKILVSACLTGTKCRYNGGHKLSPEVMGFLKGKEFISICPELLSGFSVPHPPSEIIGGNGKDVLEGNAKVVNVDGTDVTGEYIQGALLTLKSAVENSVNIAILKEKSPACGVNYIHNGKFRGELTGGNGVTAAILDKHGIKVFSEKNIDILL